MIKCSSVLLNIALYLYIVSSCDLDWQTHHQQKVFHTQVMFEISLTQPFMLTKAAFI